MQQEGGDSGPRRELVLVGGGHTHVQVLRKHRMTPLPRARVTVIVDRPVAVYSGMVPGVVSGQYRGDEAEIDVRPLARGAGARCIVARALRVDPVQRLVELEGRPPIRYDLASINVGSSVAGLDLPGVRAHALATRPIGRFVQAIQERVATLGPGPLRVVVVGAGAAGVELAFTTAARLRSRGAQPRVTLLDAGDHPLPGRSKALVERVLEAAAARGITVRTGCRVEAVEADAVQLVGGERLPSELTIWAAGAAPPPLIAASPLPTDAQGYVLVDDDLRVQGHDDLFAVGDCAVLASWPQIPKAGVYAVRQGPVLVDNLAALLEGHQTRSYVPQKDFLSLLNLGDGTAIGEKWGRPIEGAWVWQLKHTIDQRFMDRFVVLEPEGRPAEAFERGMPAMPEMDMVCGGCAAKVGESALARVLGRLPPVDDADVVLGLQAPDDAAAVQRSNELVVQSIDAFPAFTDDAWLVGKVAALNATSDLFATGVQPRTALAVVTVPDDGQAEETLFQVMAGARAALDADGCTLIGGHSTIGPQLSVGFAVTGFAAEAARLWRTRGVVPGDAIVLTRGLGTGVLLHADMLGRATGPWMQALFEAMQRGNRRAAAVAADFPVHAVTDVTGFGLAGHLGEMLRGSSASGRLAVADLPCLPGARELLAMGLRSTFHDANRAAMRALRVLPSAHAHPALELLFDPQTAGGLLIGLPAASAPALVDALRAGPEPDAAIIAEVVATDSQGAICEIR